MKNNNLGKLLTKTWFLLIFAAVLGYISGGKFQEIYGVEMYGFELIVALYSFSFLFTGLMVGYNFSSKK